MQIEVHQPTIDDLDSEMSLLGAILNRSSVRDDWDIEDVAAIVPVEAFYRPQYQSLYRIILETHRAGKPIEWLVIAPKIKAVHEGADWDAELVLLSESYADTVQARFYAARVRDAYMRRRIIQICTDGIERVGEIDSEPDAVCNWIATEVDRVESLAVTDKESLTERMMIEATPNPNTHSTIRVPVGIGRLGDLLGGGLEDGSLTVIGARPSRGKTSLGLGLCLHAVNANDGCSCVFVSAEMGQRQLSHRLIGMRTRLSISRIRSGDLGEREFERARDSAIGMVDREIEGGRQIHIIDGVMDVGQIKSLVRREVRQNAIGMCCIDYLGRLNIRGDFKRHDLMIGQIAKEFKTLAVESNIAVVLLCQLSRAQVKEGNRRPNLGDLRDSGLIECESDQVILIHVPGDKVDVQGVSETTLIIAKMRQGEIGDARVLYHKATMSYEGMYYGPGSTHPEPGCLGEESRVPF